MNISYSKCELSNSKASRSLPTSSIDEGYLEDVVIITPSHSLGVNYD